MVSRCPTGHGGYRGYFPFWPFWAFDLETGHRLWSLNLGTIQRASPVLADGKLYVGTVNGKFYIVRPGAESAEVLSEVQLGSQFEIEEIVASVAISRGRVYLASSHALYCIGEGSESTRFAAIDAAAIGQIGQDQVKWQELGFLGGYSSPVIDRDRVYQIDNAANFVAFDLETGNRL